MSRAVPILALLLAACGPQRFLSPTFPDNDAAHLDAVLRRLAAAPPRADAAVAIGVGRDPIELYAWDLREQRIRWRQPVDARTEPYLAGGGVITHEGDEIVDRSLTTGEVRLRLPDHGMQLVGADGERGLVAYALARGSGVATRSRLVVVRDHRVVIDAEVPQAFGRPAVRGGLVFAPWGGQNLSVFDGITAEEVCRLRVSDAIVGHAVARGHQVYFGQRGLGRVTRDGVAGSRQRFGWFEPAADGLPGGPSMMRDLYGGPVGPHSAAHRIELAWSPVEEADRVGMVNDSIYLVFYKLVFALAAHDGRVRWVREHSADVVGTRVLEGGLLLADAMGGLTYVEAEHGRQVWHQETGLRPGVVQIHVDALAPEGEPEEEPRSTMEQLVSAARNVDSRLVLARRFAVEQLGEVPDDAATGALLELCDEPTLAAEVRQAACESLAGRENGVDVALSALERHASFVDGTRAPPLGSIASLVARAGDRSAVPLLVEHLRDPATPVEELPPLFDALATLGGEEALGPIERFLRLYHAEEPDPALAQALGHAARAAMELREGESEAVDAILEDPLTMPEAAAAIREAVDSHTTVEPVAEEEEEELEPEAPLPNHLTPADVRAVLDPLLPRLRLCLATDNRVYRSARLIIVVRDTGEMERVTVNPREAQPCIYNLIHDARWPRTRSLRQQMRYVIRR